MTTLLPNIKYKLAGSSKMVLCKGARLLNVFRLQESMVIFGEPRSGSTWLMELLAYERRVAIVWEPTHPIFGITSVAFRYERRIFEDPSNKNSPLAKYIADILTLKRANNWTLKFTTANDIVCGTNTLTKFVHGTLLLPWILSNIALNYVPIYIIRHPIATALSQIKSGMQMKDEMMSDETFQRLYSGKYHEYKKYLDSLNDQLERLVAMWCLYHKYVIPYLKNDNKLILIYYENLLMNPADELRKIRSRWSINIDVDLTKIRKPSKTDFYKQLKQNPLEQLEKWKNQLSSSEKDRIQNILNYFEITIYDVNNAFPTKR